MQCHVTSVYGESKEKSEPPFQSELKNPIAEVYGGAEAWPENEVSLLKYLRDHP